MKKKIKWIVLALVLVLLALAGYALLSPKQEAYTPVTAQTGTITTYYNFEGNVIASSTQTLNAAAADTVRELYVNQNDQVQKGDRILRLTDGGVVTADMTGEVTGLFVSADDVVGAGQELAQIANLSAMEIEVKVDEYDIGAVHIGQSAQVTVEALETQSEATVKSINKLAATSSDLSYYMVTLGFVPDEGVLPGMRVSAKMISAQAQDVVTLKMGALYFDAYNQPYVLVRDGKGVREVPVSVGVNDGIDVEITSGLAAGDTVLSGERRGDMVQRMMEMRAQMMR